MASGVAATGQSQDPLVRGGGIEQERDEEISSIRCMRSNLKEHIACVRLAKRENEFLASS